MRKGDRTSNIIAYIFIVIISVFFLLPIIWIGTTSFKLVKDVNTLPPKLLFEPTWNNYMKALEKENF